MIFHLFKQKENCDVKKGLDFTKERQDRNRFVEIYARNHHKYVCISDLFCPHMILLKLYWELDFEKSYYAKSIKEGK